MNTPPTTSLQTSLPELDRSKSYQNCRETDVTGYNDCPIFLFDINKKKTSGNSVLTNNKDVFASAKHQHGVAPPPIGMRKRSNNECSTKLDVPPPLGQQKTTTTTTTTPLETNSTTPDNVTEGTPEDPSVENITQLLKEMMDVENTKLSNKEFQYYNLKMSKNVDMIIGNEHYRNVLAHVFLMAPNTERINVLNNWVISEPLISSWFPSFRKLLENKK